VERERQKRWDRQNMYTVSTALREGEYWRLHEMCRARRVTAYALIKRLLRDWMSGGGSPPAAPLLIC